MIARLQGLLEEIGKGEVLIHISGISYLINIPESIIPNLPLPGEEVSLCIYTYVREDHLNLYGFLTKRERDLFVSLLGVSRIGPSVALKILSSIEVEDFVQAILREDVDTLKDLPGIGKKTAQRMILDLKTPLENFPLPIKEKREALPPDIVDGLINLGYTSQEAREAILSVVKSVSATDEETIMRLALRRLAK